jgi:hypothetical protein
MNTTVSTAEQLRFPTIAGHTVRARFDGGSMSSDFGALLVRGVDRQIGLTQRLAAALTDRRHPSYVEHSLQDLLAQRIYQVACGYEDQIDANSLRHDPVFKMSVERLPCDPQQALASQSTHSRLENSVRRKDVYRAAAALIEQFIASYAEPPPIIVLEFDHSEDRTHGQQAFSYYNAHYGQHCYLPLFVFEGLSGRLVTAILRPGKTPTGRENAAILQRILKVLRAQWPDTHIVVRGDGHFSNPELMDLIDQDPLADFVFGLSNNKALARWAQPIVTQAAKLHRRRCEQAQRAGESSPPSTRLYEERSYQARSWSKPRRVVLKAEVMALGENPRFVVTSLDRPTPQTVYEELYCQRGNDENYIKALKLGFKSDRTSDGSFLANHMRLLFACAAYVLVHAMRTETLRGTELEKAEPSTLMNKLFKIATKVVQYKDRIILHLPTVCPVKDLMQKITEILYLVPPLVKAT